MTVTSFPSLNSLFPSEDSFPPTIGGQVIFGASCMAVNSISSSTLGKFISFTLGKTAHFVKERCYSVSYPRLSEEQKKTAAQVAHLACLLLGLAVVTTVASLVSARATSLFQKILVASAYTGCLSYFTGLPNQKDRISCSFYHVVLEDGDDPEFFSPSKKTIDKLERDYKQTCSKKILKDLDIAYNKEKCLLLFFFAESLTQVSLISIAGHHHIIAISAVKSTAFTLAHMAYAKYRWSVPEKSSS